MRDATLITSLLLLLLIPSACSVEDEVKPIASQTMSQDALIMEGFRQDLGLSLDITPAFLVRQQVIKSEMENQMRPDVEQLIAIGKEGLAKYHLDPALISINPNDPQFALMAVLVHQLEGIYAAGYSVVLADGPVVDLSPEAKTLGECFLEAAGLEGVVRLVKDGAGAAGLTGEIVIGTFFRMTIRTALGWVGAGIIAWQAGNCVAEVYRADIPIEDMSEDAKKRYWEKIMKNLTHTRRDFINLWGDTATLVFHEAYPNLNK